MTKGIKNYKKCYAWKVHPGFGYVCYDMCDEDKRKMCIEDFKKDKLKTPCRTFLKDRFEQN
jgi:hypothetical protein